MKANIASIECGRLAGDSHYPQIADSTAPFVYARIMGTTEGAPLGYAEKDLDRWVDRARLLASGRVPEDLAQIGKAPAAKADRDVFLYVISGFKARDPAAAMAMIQRLGAVRSPARRSAGHRPQVGDK